MTGNLDTLHGSYIEAAAGGPGNVEFQTQSAVLVDGATGTYAAFGQEKAPKPGPRGDLLKIIMLRFADKVRKGGIKLNAQQGNQMKLVMGLLRKNNNMWRQSAMELFKTFADSDALLASLTRPEDKKLLPQLKANPMRVIAPAPVPAHRRRMVPVFFKEQAAERLEKFAGFDRKLAPATAEKKKRINVAPGRTLDAAPPMPRPMPPRKPTNAPHREARLSPRVRARLRKQNEYADLKVYMNRELLSARPAPHAPEPDAPTPKRDRRLELEMRRRAARRNLPSPGMR